MVARWETPTRYALLGEEVMRINESQTQNRAGPFTGE